MSNRLQTEILLQQYWIQSMTNIKIYKHTGQMLTSD